MSEIFNEYCSQRDEQTTNDMINEFCVDLCSCGLSSQEIFENVVVPAIAFGDYSNQKDLICELRGFFNKLFGRNAQEDPETVALNSPKALTPIDPKNVDPYAFRNRANRVTSRPDMIQQNKDVEAQNVAADKHNMNLQKRDIRNQEGDRLKKIRNDMTLAAGQLKKWLTRQLYNAVNHLDNMALPRHKQDVLRQFAAAVDQAGQQFQPGIDLNRYYKDPNFSGVKSGLQAQHKAPDPKAQGAYYGDKPGYGQYDPNQKMGDEERGYEQYKQAGFKNRARQLFAGSGQQTAGAPQKVSKPNMKKNSKKEHVELTESLVHMMGTRPTPANPLGM